MIALQELYLEELVRLYEKRDLVTLGKEARSPMLKDFLIRFTMGVGGNKMHVQYIEYGTNRIIRNKY